jgi:hypothetical protein
MLDRPFQHRYGIGELEKYETEAGKENPNEQVCRKSRCRHGRQ